MFPLLRRRLREARGEREEGRNRIIIIDEALTLALRLGCFVPLLDMAVAI